MALPGSQLYKNAVENNIKLPESYEGYSFHSYETQPLPTDTLKAEEILKFRDISYKNYHTYKPFLSRIEKKFGKNTRFDFLLLNKKSDKKAFLEVKSVSLSRKKYHSEFPDAVTDRGKKHLENLILANHQGYESYLLFLVQIEKLLFEGSQFYGKEYMEGSPKQAQLTPTSDAKAPTNYLNAY